MKKKWRILETVSTDALKQFPEMHPIIVQLLQNRGITTQRNAERFLTPDYLSDSHDPFLFQDMEKAVQRIFKAVEEKEKIVVYGDYDADGVSASALLYEMLHTLGATPHVHLPHREKEGYGMNMEAAKEFIKKKFQLVITCDCGTTSVEEVSELQKNGIDVIVTDHHVQTNDGPPAFAILNPARADESYPFKGLVGTGVTFKLAQAVYVKLREQGKILEGEEKWLLDLVAVATIADFGRLIDENRTYVKYGLVVLNKTRREGFKSLRQFLNGNVKELNSENIGYQLVPRLNAASRMGHANTAFELLIEKKSVKAFELAEQLHTLNISRQKVSEQMFADSKKQIGEDPSDTLLVTVGEGWQAGVVGLVAGKILNTYNRPALVIGTNKDEIVGSGRSIDAFDITKALSRVSGHLEKFGGHPQACGFTVKQNHLDAFVVEMKEQARNIRAADLQKELIIDAVVDIESISWELWDTLKEFEPFGQGNPRPIFISKNVTIEEVRIVGNGGKHMQLVVKGPQGKPTKVIAFGFAEEWASRLPRGKKVDLAYEVSINEWNGNRELQLKLVDIKTK